MSFLSAYDLRTEHRRSPLGVDVEQPRLSWRLRSTRRGDLASAVRVVCRQGDAIVWDSGWVAEVPADGFVVDAELAPLTRYDWNLALRDVDGEEVDGGSAWFETGYLGRPLPGAWIARDRRFDRADRAFDPPVDDGIPFSVRRIPPALQLRGAFELEQGVRRARLSVTSRGIYRAYVNGERTGTEELSPGWTDYNDRILYQTYDVTERLREGENVLGLVVADGWWSGYIGFDSRRQGNFYGDFPAGWAALELELEDGNRRTFTTDESWKELPGEVFYTDLLMGEYVDRRRNRDGWTEPGYDASEWGPVIVTDADLSKLSGQIDEPIRVTEELPAVSVTTDPEGRFIYDFGQNLVGRVRLRLGSMARDAQIVVRHGEMLDDGRLYTANLRTAEARDVYVSDGAGDDVFEPAFTLHGFRYIEVSGDLAEPPAIEDVVALVMHNDVEWSGEVTTSDPMVNKLIENIRWGQRDNFVAVPTDCPQRDERLGWLADAQVFLPTAALNADVQSFFTRWMRDVRFAQSAEGSFEDVAPVISLEFNDGAPAWGDGGVIMPWHLYRAYGDERMLRESLPSMKRWVDFIERNNPSLIWTKRVGMNYGDWLQVDAATSRSMLATAYFARSTTIVADSATALGETEDATAYASLAARIRAAFLDTFVQPDGRIAGDTQTAYLLALAFDLVPDQLRESIAGHLVRTIEEHDGLLTTGFVGVSLLCPVLSEIGRDDLAFSLLQTEEYPSWLYSVRHGATTIWERWDGWTEHGGFQSAEMNSFNHYSLGSVGEWLYRYAAGIDQAAESVAYRRLRLHPRVGGSLTHVSGSYQSPLGRIASGWARDGETTTYSFEIPPGATAEVTVTGSDPRIDGVPLAEHGDVRRVAVSGASTSFELASGVYEVRTGS